MPITELAHHFEKYFYENDHFTLFFKGKTQLFRSLVHEEYVTKNDHSEILDWERASYYSGN